MTTVRLSEIDCSLYEAPSDDLVTFYYRSVYGKIYHIDELAKSIEDRELDNKGEYYHFMDTLIHDINMKDLIIAGGSVLTLLSGTYNASLQDIDIYDYSGNPDRIMDYIEEIKKKFQIVYSFSYEQITNIYIKYNENIYILQYIKWKATDPTEIITSFDEDFCKIYISEGKIYTQDRFVKNIIYKYTIVNTDKFTGILNAEFYFNKRMIKYLDRGYMFKFPEDTKIEDNKLYIKDYGWLYIVNTYFCGVQNMEYEQIILYTHIMKKENLVRKIEEYEKQIYDDLFNDRIPSDELINKYMHELVDEYQHMFCSIDINNVKINSL